MLEAIAHWFWGGFIILVCCAAIPYVGLWLWLACHPYTGGEFMSQEEKETM